MQEKYILGVTGSMGCGKSYVCKELVRLSQSMGTNAIHIDFDTIRRNNDLPYDETRKRLSISKGLVLFEWAMLTEDGYLPLVDNVLLVKCDYETQLKRLIGGDLPEVELRRRIKAQLSNDQKEARIQATGKKLFVLDTNPNLSEETYQNLLEEILQ